MKTDDFVMWKDVPIRIYHKIFHIHKINKKYHKDFTYDWGDIPLMRLNLITNKFEPVINTRGYGYARRRDIKYRRKLK